MKEYDVSRLTRLGVRINRVQSDVGEVVWSFRASPFVRMVKGAGLGLLAYLCSHMVSGYQFIGVAVLAAWAIWLFAFVPRKRLRIGIRRCELETSALVFGAIPIHMSVREFRDVEPEVWMTSYGWSHIPRFAIGLRTANGRRRIWTFPLWMNVAKFREETESAVNRLAVLLRRDLSLPLVEE